MAVTISMIGGSSPLARGLPDHGVVARVVGRIIPARAGFTPASPTPSSTPSDHPRSRGVYSCSPETNRESLGSSPLARGLLPASLSDEDNPGIIPARAGFTPRLPVRRGQSWDHPRSRGVYRSKRSPTTTSGGSSPLARGLPPRVEEGERRRGIIPARAGFTPTTRTSTRNWGDHPRSRGVYDARRRGYQSSPGSSPLARGLRQLHGCRQSRGRIIPARAGFTGSRPAGRGRNRDHPRSRGVYPRPDPRERIREGSSPLARGLPRGGSPPRRRSWIIPARAGFTAADTAVKLVATDHPRSRGVYG